MNLNNREKELLALLCRGYTAKQAALQMGLKHQTIKNMLMGIKKRNGNPTRDKLIYLYTVSMICPQRTDTSL